MYLSVTSDSSIFHFKLNYFLNFFDEENNQLLNKMNLLRITFQSRLGIWFELSFVPNSQQDDYKHANVFYRETITLRSAGWVKSFKKYTSIADCAFLLDCFLIIVLDRMQGQVYMIIMELSYFSRLIYFRRYAFLFLIYRRKCKYNL